jgi:sporulation protein YqfC
MEGHAPGWIAHAGLEGPMAETKKKLLEKAADAFDLPADVVAGLPRIEITGCRELLIENHRGILEYGEEEIDVNGGRVIVKVKGNGLQLKSMNATELMMCGTILSVEFVF